MTNTQTEAKILSLFSARTEQYDSQEECITWLNEEGTFGSLKVPGTEGRFENSVLNRKENKKIQKIL